MKLHMFVYLRAKFEVSSIPLTGCRHGVVLPLTDSKQTPKKRTHIRVKLSSVKTYSMKQFISINSEEISLN